MKLQRAHWTFLLGLGLVAASCSDEQGALSPPPLDQGGSSSTAGGGSTAGSKSGGSAVGGSGSDAGGAGGGVTEGGAPGTAGEGSSGAPDAAGAGGTSCIYDKHAASEGGAASDGAGGAEVGAGGDGAAPGITVLVSPYVGKYLADAEGRPLYIWGADLPGDCEHDPVSRCGDTCTPAWPSFYAADPGPAPELPAGVFGSILDPRGAPMTTYYGWPLYYYGLDTFNATTAKWSVDGQGKGKAWHLAEVNPPNVVIMKEGTTLYLADGSGFSLYAYAEDEIGATPSSNCTADCLQEHPAFVATSISAVSSLESSDLTLFVRADDDRQQVAYKGAPLYFSSEDQRSGDHLGAEVVGWSLVIP